MDLPVAPGVLQGQVEHAAGFVGLLAGGNLTRGDAGGDPVAPRARRLGDQGEGFLSSPACRTGNLALLSQATGQTTSSNTPLPRAGLASGRLKALAPPKLVR
jgi:hypothetical protein